MATPTEPECGLFEGVDFETYQALDAWNRGALVRLFDSPFAAKFGKGKPQTDAMRFGDATHVSILEPERLRAEWATMPRYHKSMLEETAKASPDWDGGRDKYAAWMKEHGHKKVLKAKDAIDIACIRGSLKHAKAAQMFLNAPGGKAETVIVWTDPETGVTCKVKMDWHFPNKLKGVTILDLKSMASVGQRDFDRAVEKFHLHIQASLYRKAMLHHLGKESDYFGFDGDGVPFAFLCVQRYPPYTARVFELSSDFLEIGEREVDRMLRVIAWCESTGEWPDWGDKIMPYATPRPYRNEYQLPEGYCEPE